jgi:hypothetical protein
MGRCAQPIGLRGDMDKRQVEEQIQGVLVYALYGLTPAANQTGGWRSQMKPKSELILYQTEDNRTRIEVRLENETVWLSLNQLAVLFQRDKSVISRHIRNVFEEGELPPEATVAEYATVQTEGARTVSREIEFYNLDVIISVGYRVKSQRRQGQILTCGIWPRIGVCA